MTFTGTNRNGSAAEQVAKGNRSGMSLRKVFGGFRGLSGLNELWFPGGAKVWAKAASTLSVVSTSADDTSAGSGARTILITGLGIDGDAIQAPVTMNGLTPVVTTKAFFRVDDDVKVISTGTYGNPSDSANHGDITITRTFDDEIESVISVDTSTVQMGVSTNSHSTVPSNHKGTIDTIVINNDKAQPADFFFHTRSAFGVASAPFNPILTKAIFTQNTGLTQIDLSDNPIFIPPFTDIWFSATLAGGGDAQVCYTMKLDRISI